MYQQLNLNTKLTLKEFIELFNSEVENSFSDQFYIKTFDTDGNTIDPPSNYYRTIIVPRNYTIIRK